MMRRYNEVDLALSHRHIAEAEEQIEKIGNLLKDLEAREQPTKVARELLDHYRASLASHRRHRDAVLADLQAI